DSIGSTATAEPPKEEQSPALPSDSAQSVVARKMVPAPLKPVAPTGEPRIGMTRDQVRASTWGRPLRTENSEDLEGLTETWFYGDTLDERHIQFDGKGRVTLVQQ